MSASRNDIVGVYAVPICHMSNQNLCNEGPNMPSALRAWVSVRIFNEIFGVSCVLVTLGERRRSHSGLGSVGESLTFLCLRQLPCDMPVPSIERTPTRNDDQPVPDLQYNNPGTQAPDYLQDMTCGVSDTQTYSKWDATGKWEASLRVFATVHYAPRKVGRKSPVSRLHVESFYREVYG